MSLKSIEELLPPQSARKPGQALLSAALLITMAFQKAGIIKAPSLSLENESRSLSAWHRQEKAFPKLLCFPQELSPAAGQSSQEPPAGMLPSAPTRGGERARENQPARESWMGNLRLFS